MRPNVKHFEVVNRIRVISLEDDPAFTSLLEARLESEGLSCAVERVDTREEFLAMVTAREWDVILADYSLPSYTGLEALCDVRQLGKEIPFIIISGSIGESLAVEAMRAGARDYLLKHELGRLAPVIQRELQEAREHRERSEAMARLAAAQDRLRLIADAIDQVFWYVRLPDRKIEYLSSAIERVTGRRASDVVGGGLSWTDLVHEEDAPKMGLAFSEWLKAGAKGPLRQEFRVLHHPDGELRWVMSVGSVIRSESGELTAACGVATDISERRLAEEKLRTSEFRLAGIINSASDAILCANSEMRIVLFNPAAEQMFRCAAREALGTRLERFIPEGYRAGHERHVRDFSEAAAGRKAMERNTRLSGLRSTGEVFPMEASVSQTVVEGERLFTVILRDISDRRRAEEQRSSLEAQLLQAQKMEAIGTLAGGIAHDFNNILGAVVGYTQLIQQDAAHLPPVQEFSSAILQASFRARDLVRQILTFSRQQGAELQALEAGLVVKEALKLLRAAIPSTIEIRDHVMGDLPAVMADPTQVHQVLMNLATNAAYAMRRGGGRLTVGLERVDLDEEGAKRSTDLHAGSYVCLTVEDTGEGMTPAVLDRIFEPFFTTKEQGEGTGLGLSVVHGIVRTHGGAVLATSRPGEGTRFEVFLPAVEKKPTEIPAPSSPAFSGRGERILFVDDEPNLVMVARHVLERLGYVVHSENDPLVALEIFSKRPLDFDLLLTDLTMPKMDGLQLSEAIRGIRGDLPILLMTGFGGDQTRSRMRELGINGLVPKPSTVDVLGTAVRRALDGEGE